MFSRFCDNLYNHLDRFESYADAAVISLALLVILIQITNWMVS